MAKELGEKKQAFAKAYVILLDGTEAAKRAGYAKGSAHVTASRLLKDPRVKQQIAKEQLKLAKDHDLDPAKVLKELQLIAFARITDTVTWNEHGVGLVPSDQLTADQAAALAEVRQTKDGFAVKAHDKLAALDKLGRHLGLFESKDDKPAGVTIVINRLFDEPQPRKAAP